MQIQLFLLHACITAFVAGAAFLVILFTIRHVRHQAAGEIAEAVAAKEAAEDELRKSRADRRAVLAATNDLVSRLHHFSKHINRSARVGNGHLALEDLLRMSEEMDYGLALADTFLDTYNSSSHFAPACVDLGETLKWTASHLDARSNIEIEIIDEGLPVLVSQPKLALALRALVSHLERLRCTHVKIQVRKAEGQACVAFWGDKSLHFTAPSLESITATKLVEILGGRMAYPTCYRDPNVTLHFPLFTTPKSPERIVSRGSTAGSVAVKVL